MLLSYISFQTAAFNAASDSLKGFKETSKGPPEEKKRTKKQMSSNYKNIF
jgi:hypothetical protein